MFFKRPAFESRDPGRIRFASLTFSLTSICRLFSTWLWMLVAPIDGSMRVESNAMVLCQVEQFLSLPSDSWSSRILGWLAFFISLFARWSTSKWTWSSLFFKSGNLSGYFLLWGVLWAMQCTGKFGVQPVPGSWLWGLLLLATSWDTDMSIVFVRSNYRRGQGCYYLAFFDSPFCMID